MHPNQDIYSLYDSDELERATLKLALYEASGMCHACDYVYFKRKRKCPYCKRKLKKPITEEDKDKCLEHYLVEFVDHVEDVYIQNDYDAFEDLQIDYPLRPDYLDRNWFDDYDYIRDNCLEDRYGEQLIQFSVNGKHYRAEDVRNLLRQHDERISH